MRSSQPGCQRGGVAKTKLTLAIGTCLAVLNACSPQAQHGSNQARESSSLPLAATVSAPAVTGEVPADLLSAIMADLVQQGNLLREDIRVERAESVVWPDGSLGCPVPGEMYTQAQVPGFWVVLSAGNKKYDYRASSTGHFRLCSNPFKKQNPVG